ncbi:MAG: hypothetical protein EHM20_18365 [Alphaproteobacteria bacterium]|nr:MAG: hypothetical protein EHM20_18365 [Alphaproteobacteria bacterium]
MKKVMILAVVAALLGISAPNLSAQVPGSTQPSSTEDEREQTESPSTAPAPAPGTTTQPQGTEATQYSEEVKVADLPAGITRSLNEKYPGFKTDKAFKAKDGTYKVKVSKGDEAQVLFFDARGEVIKMQSKHQEVK